MNDPYDLTRFLKAEEGNYETALHDIRIGRRATERDLFFRK